MQTSFHDRRTGEQRGPGILSIGNEAVRHVEEGRLVFRPFDSSLVTRMIRTERTTIGFSDVPAEKWNALFRKETQEA